MPLCAPEGHDGSSENPMPKIHVSSVIVNAYLQRQFFYACGILKDDDGLVQALEPEVSAADPCLIVGGKLLVTDGGLQLLQLIIELFVGLRRKAFQDERIQKDKTIGNIRRNSGDALSPDKVFRHDSVKLSWTIKPRQGEPREFCEEFWGHHT